MTTRRTFLRVLGAAVVGAVVAPSFPIPGSDPATYSWWRSHAGLGSPAPLSSEALREAFNACTRGGGMAPTHFITTRAVAESYARMCGLVYDVEMAA